MEQTDLILSDKQRIERLEETLATVIGWLYARPFGAHEVKQLMDMLGKVSNPD